MKNNTSIRKNFVLLLGMLLWSSASFAEIAIVVSKDSPLNNITAKEAKRIFLGVTKKLPNGQSIKIVDYAGNKSLQQDFYLAVTNKSVSEIRNRWAGLAFSGKAVPPISLQTINEVKAWLRANTNGVGYLNPKDIDDTLKLIYTTQ